MDILATVLKALAAQQTIQATRRTATGNLMAAALLPVGLGTFLIGLGFLGYAGYSAMIPDLSPALAASIIAGGLFLITLCIGLAAWAIRERSRIVRPPELDLSPLHDALGKMSSEVQKSPGSSMMLAALAGAFAYVAFLDRL